MSTVIQSLPESLESCLRESPLTSELLDHWNSLKIPDCWLVAGAVVQTYWNRVHGYPHDYGIADIDIIYFDNSDLSEQAEANHSARINRLFNGLGVRCDVKNEARVHLWYAERFGYLIDPYTSSEAAMATFPTTAGAIGIRPSGKRLEAYAPFGFDDLLQLVVRANKVQITSTIYNQKAVRWRAKWPKLVILDWEQAQSVVNCRV